ncbi:acetyltransferase, GNAT family protein [Calothrix sp. NIES-4071]|nr:acetyltransferase, GNAT family protein [Calothrix sp. NIES-4071]BAZ55561.1 acetyltransferase, GNAT family protein [Calothrix sp. NIES-4105]
MLFQLLYLYSCRTVRTKMQNRFYLPPNFFIRRARSRDKWKIKQLLLTWHEVSNILPINVFTLSLILLCFFFLWFNAIIFAIIIALYLLYEVRLKDYSDFWVIDYNGATIGCAELRVYKKYSLIFNLCIKKEFRHQKLASCMIEHLISEAKEPIYLSCFKELIPFYTRFGFIVIHPDALPDGLQLVLGTTQSSPIVPMMLG